MGKHCSCIEFIKAAFLLQVMLESVLVLQSCTLHLSACNEIEGSYDKIIITIVPSHTGKISLTCCHWHCSLTLRTHNNTDRNKLMIFSSMALHYSDNYIVFTLCVQVPTCLENECLHKGSNNQFNSCLCPTPKLLHVLTYKLPTRE